MKVAPFIASLGLMACTAGDAPHKRSFDISLEVAALAESIVSGDHTSERFCQVAGFSLDGQTRSLSETDAIISAVIDEMMHRSPIGSMLTQEETGKVRKSLRLAYQDIVFECQHEWEVALLRLFKKSLDAIYRAPTQEEAWIAFLWLFTLAYFLICYPAWYVSVMHKILIDHSAAASLGYTIFGTGSTLGSMKAYFDGSLVTSVGYGILAVLAGITIVANEFCKHQLKTGAWTPKNNRIAELTEELDRANAELTRFRDGS